MAGILYWNAVGTAAFGGFAQALKEAWLPPQMRRLALMKASLIGSLMLSQAGEYVWRANADAEVSAA
jgi:hypothetical protein